MTAQKKQTHEFASIPDFDKAMRHLVSVPKEVAEKKVAEKQHNKKRRKK